MFNIVQNGIIIRVKADIFIQINKSITEQNSLYIPNNTFGNTSVETAGIYKEIYNQFTKTVSIQKAVFGDGTTVKVLEDIDDLKDLIELAESSTLTFIT